MVSFEWFIVVLFPGSPLNMETETEWQKSKCNLSVKRTTCTTKAYLITIAKYNTRVKAHHG